MTLKSFIQNLLRHFFADKDPNIHNKENRVLPSVIVALIATFLTILSCLKDINDWAQSWRFGTEVFFLLKFSLILGGLYVTYQLITGMNGHYKYSQAERNLAKIGFLVLLAFFVGLIVCSIVSKLQSVGGSPKVKIDFPSGSEEISSPIEVKGTCHNVPEGKTIWIIIKYHDDPTHYYPKSTALCKAEDNWQANFEIVVEDENISTKTIDILVFLADRDFDEKLSRVAEEGGTVPSPSGHKLYDNVTVNLVPATPTPTHTPTDTATPAPEPTTPVSEPTTPVPEPTAPVPEPTAPTPGLPDAHFVEDVTVPDGTEFKPGESFTKTWRILSCGCVPWPDGTNWVFVSGDLMGAPESISVPHTPLSKTADISVNMVAPDEPGTYEGCWQMQDPNGGHFGDQVYVGIVVPTPTPTLTPTTPTPTLCPPNACLEGDVTDKAGTEFEPRETFTKTWRMLSCGCVPWPDGTNWVFVAGDLMSAPTSVPVPDTPLSDTVDISVNMMAPDKPGTYEGCWQMQDPNGDCFGNRVYVRIVVPTPTPALLAAPTLVEPENDHEYCIFDEIILKWKWDDRPFKENEFYAVRIWKDDPGRTERSRYWEEHYDVKTYRTIPKEDALKPDGDRSKWFEGENAYYRWNVVVLLDTGKVDEQGYKIWEAVSETSESRRFFVLPERHPKCVP